MQGGASRHLEKLGHFGIVQDCRARQGCRACEGDIEPGVIKLPIIVHDLHSTGSCDDRELYSLHAGLLLSARSAHFSGGAVSRGTSNSCHLHPAVALSCTHSESVSSTSSVEC